MDKAISSNWEKCKPIFTTPHCHGRCQSISDNTTTDLYQLPDILAKGGAYFIYPRDDDGGDDDGLTFKSPHSVETHTILLVCDIKHQKQPEAFTTTRVEWPRQPMGLSRDPKRHHRKSLPSACKVLRFYTQQVHVIYRLARIKETILRCAWLSKSTRA